MDYSKSFGEKIKIDNNMENIIHPWLNEVNKQTKMEIDFENKSIPFK